MPSSSDSSSDDEDLSAFQSVAVTFEDLHRHQVAEAKKVKSRVDKRTLGVQHASALSQQSPASALKTTTATDDGEQPAEGGDAVREPQQDLFADMKPRFFGEEELAEVQHITQKSKSMVYQGDDGNDNPLDLVAKKIAAALDHLLDRKLAHYVASSSDPGGNPGSEEEGTSKKSKKKKKNIDAADDQETNRADGEELLGPGVRLFKRVKRGTPCIMRVHQQESADGERFRVDRLEKYRPSTKDIKQTLVVLADDMASLVQDLPKVLEEAKVRSKKSGGRRLPVHGVVLEPSKTFVPYEDRCAKLLGQGIQKDTGQSIKA